MVDVNEIIELLSAGRNFLANPIKNIHARLKENSKYHTSVNEAKEILALFESITEIEQQIKLHPELKESKEFQQFIRDRFPEDAKKLFEEYSPREVEDGTIEFITKEETLQEIEETQEGLEKDLDIPKIWIWGTSKTAYSFEDIENNKNVLAPDIKGIIEFLNPYYLKLLRLSVESEDLYKQNRFEEGDAIKYIIFKKYGWPGLKFCNLYTSGYLKSFFIYLLRNKELTKTKCLDEVNDFINRVTDGIFFVHRHMDAARIDKISATINKFLKSGEGYIAIHSIKLPNLTKDLLNSINDPNKSYTIMRSAPDETNHNEFIRIWYNGTGGENLLKMIERYHNLVPIENQKL